VRYNITTVAKSKFRSFRSVSIRFDSGIEIAKTFRSRAGHFDLFRRNSGFVRSAELSQDSPARLWKLRVLWLTKKNFGTRVWAVVGNENPAD
jgi:hypothetical protein